MSNHPLAGAIRDQQALRLFMEHHVFAVWDFLLLAKALQRQLTDDCQAGASPGVTTAKALIDRIVAEEESDLAPANLQGASRLSHLEIYLLAMREVGARTTLIEALMARLRGAEPWTLSPAKLDAALQGLPVPQPSRQFMAFTFMVIGSRAALPMAAAFTHGRELLVPSLFQALLEQAPISQSRTPALHWYFTRHIAIDGDDHGPGALAMLRFLCGDFPARQQAADAIARRAVEARQHFWDGIHQALIAMPPAIPVAATSSPYRA